MYVAWIRKTRSTSETIYVTAWRENFLGAERFFFYLMNQACNSRDAYSGRVYSGNRQEFERRCKEELNDQPLKYTVIYHRCSLTPIQKQFFNSKQLNSTYAISWQPASYRITTLSSRCQLPQTPHITWKLYSGRIYHTLQYISYTRVRSSNSSLKLTNI